MLSKNNKTKYFFLLLCIFLARIGTVYAASKHGNSNKNIHYSFIFDPYSSSYTSASCLISTRSLLNRLDDMLIDKEQEKSFWVKWPNLVVNNLFNDLFMLWQHEVNGHGFRGRSFGKSIVGYGLEDMWGGAIPSIIVPMLTPVNGFGAFTTPDFDPDKLSIDEELLWTIAGNEANTVLANEMVLKNFKQGKLDYRDYNLFCKAFTNLLGYLIVTDLVQDGDDIVHYLKRLNNKYGSDSLSLTDLRWGAIVFFLNPIVYNAVWSFYAYAFNNEKELNIPCLSWDSVTYMPIIRMGLTPFGMAYYLENYVGYQDKTLFVSLQAGKLPGQAKYFGGIGGKTDGLYQYKRYALDLVANLWHQPELLLKDTDTVKDGNRWGGMLGIHNKFQISDYLSLHGALLYKSTGFLEGVVAQGGFIWQAGISFGLPLE